MSHRTGARPFAARHSDYHMTATANRRSRSSWRVWVDSSVYQLATTPLGRRSGKRPGRPRQSGLVLPRPGNAVDRGSPVVDTRARSAQSPDRRVDRRRPIAWRSVLEVPRRAIDASITAAVVRHRARHLPSGSIRPVRIDRIPGPRPARRASGPGVRIRPIHRLRTEPSARPALAFQLLQRLVQAQHEPLPRRQHRRDRLSRSRRARPIPPSVPIADPPPRVARERALPGRDPRARHRRDDAQGLRLGQAGPDSSPETSSVSVSTVATSGSDVSCNATSCTEADASDAASVPGNADCDRARG